MKQRGKCNLITKVTGKLLTLGTDTLTLEVGAFEYQILIADFSRRQLQGRIGEEISLHTIQYLEGSAMQGRLTPRLIGFLNEAEREFFEMFCSVDGVGTRKALRAMVRPVPEVARLIEEEDVKGLATLPGVGPATADRVVAKLRRRMPKFALLVARDLPEVEIQNDVVTDTYEALRSLGHSESDARRLIDTALGKKKSYKDVDALLHAIYESAS